MGNVIDPHDQSFLDDHALIQNLARYAEGLLSKEAVKKKHRLADSVWERLGTDDALVEKIEDEKLRRIHNGQAKRELAQKHVVKAPEVLNDIMLDPAANNRHKVDAIKVLDQLADNGAQAEAESARFVITINLGTDASGNAVIEHYDKPRAIGPDDTDPGGADAAMLAAIAEKKRDNDGGQGYI